MSKYETLKKYEFWKWEYQRRNPDYISAYDSYLARVDSFNEESERTLFHLGQQNYAADWYHQKCLKDGPPKGMRWKLKEDGFETIQGNTHEYTNPPAMNEQEAHKYISEENRLSAENRRKLFLVVEATKFNNNHLRFPQDYSEGIESNDLMESISNGSFGYDIDESDFSSTHLTTRLEIIDGEYHFIMNPNSAVALQQKELEFYWHCIDCIQSNSHKTKDKISACYKELLYLGIKENKEIGKFKDAREKRAAGLWLFDHLSMSPYLSDYQAVEEFANSWGTSLGERYKQLRDPKHIKDALRLAEKCIKAGSVLKES